MQPPPATPNPKKRTYSDMSTSPTSVEDPVSWPRSPRRRGDCDAPAQIAIEPFREPAVDAIPVVDLLFWLGDEPTGKLMCSCRRCRPQLCTRDATRDQRKRLHVPLPTFSGLSAKVPVIALPRIEGIYY